jgi:hypothetical protein
VEETYDQFRIHVPALKRIITLDIEDEPEYCMIIPPSVYAKAEHRLEEWSKFGTDYDNDPVFVRANHGQPPAPDNG